MFDSVEGRSGQPSENIAKAQDWLALEKHGRPADGPQPQRKDAERQRHGAGSHVPAEFGSVTIVDSADHAGAVSPGLAAQHKSDPEVVLTGPRASDIQFVRPNPDEVTTTDADGATRTTDILGVTTVRDRRGSGYTRTPQGGGAYDERHFGPRAEDNYEVRRAQDGHYYVRDRWGQPWTDRTGAESPDVRAERARISDLAESRILNLDERAQFHRDMVEFEHRAKAQNLSSGEIAGTYREISRLLDASPNSRVFEAQRVMLAEQVMSNTAHPTSIRQGIHNTCNVATVEVRTYSRNPSAAARLVADVASTGEYHTPDGHRVQVGSQSLQPDSEAQHYSRQGSERNYASQIFQVAAVNIHYESGNVAAGLPGQLRYEQLLGSGHDSGERVVDTSTNRVYRDGDDPSRQVPSVPTSEIQNISNQITGRNENDVIIQTQYRDTPNAVYAESPERLQLIISNMSRRGRLPAIIEVYADNEPFNQASDGRAHGLHVVTITGIDESDRNNPRVVVDNTWEDGLDFTGPRAIPVSQLYQATHQPARNSLTLSMEGHPMN